MSVTIASRPPTPRSTLDGGLRVAALVGWMALITLLTFVPIASNDIWLQAKIGEMIVQTGHIPRTVLFPFTWVQDNPFNAHEWVPSIAFHLLDAAMGLNRMLFVQGVFGLVLFVLSASLAARLSRSLAVGLLLGGMALVVANYRFHLRPELFALVLMVWLLALLSQYRDQQRTATLLWTIPIAIVWANSHGSFLLGPIIAGLFALGAALDVLRDRRLASWQVLQGRAARAALPYAAVASGMALASLANPMGIELLHFALTLSSSEVTSAYIAEWRPTFTAEFMGRVPFWLFVGAVCVTIAALTMRWRQLAATDALLLIAFGALACRHSRFVALYGFVAAIVCARLWDNVRTRQRERVLLGVATATAAAGIALALHFGNVWGGYPFASPSSNFTVPMSDRLSRLDMKGNVFNSYELGAELIYRAYPRLRPSIDSRIDSYGDRYFLLQDQLLYDEPLLREFIADFDVRYMLLLWRDFERIKKLPGLRQEWDVDFADQKAVLLRRVGPATRLPLAPRAPTAASTPPASPAPPPTP